MSSDSSESTESLERQLEENLENAAGQGDKDYVLHWLNKGANISYDAIETAAKNGHPDMVRFLFRHDRSLEDLHHFIFCAAGRRQKDVIEALLDLGADVNYSYNFVTALHNATKCNRPENVAILLEHGANVNYDDRSLNTPLHYACNRGNSEIAKLLLAVPEIKINAKNDEGQTPLHVASRNKSVEIVLLLLDNGADPDLRDKNGKTAFDIYPTPDVVDTIKSFQLERELKNKISELETQNKEMKKMLEETKKREVDLEKEVEELKRQMKRKEDPEDGEKMEGGAEMKSFEAVVDQLKTDLKLRAEEFERKLETRLDGIESLYKETEPCHDSQLREDETSLEDSIRDVMDRRSQLEASSGRVDMSEIIESLVSKVTAGVKMEVLSLQLSFAHHIDSSAKDIIALTELFKNASSSSAGADSLLKVNLVQLASELEEKCRATAEEDGADPAQQDQKKDEATFR